MNSLSLTEPTLDASRSSSNRQLWRRGLLTLMIPSAICTFCFFSLTYPAIWKWSTHFYCDSRDGFQNEWSLWWFRKAIVELHCSPWYTTWLHAPLGTTLIGHTLQPFNGLVGIFLGILFSRAEVYNLIMVGSFVFSGVTAFWLARHVTGQYMPSLLGGFAFTFTGYHFGQAVGHLELVSAEFFPLFVLVWLRMLERPAIGSEIVAGSVLGLNAFCDFYFFLYCSHWRSQFSPASEPLRCGNAESGDRKQCSRFLRS